LAGGHSDLGADIALHSGRFRDAIANAPYLNPNFSMGMPKGMAGGQGIGGGGLPMKQNFSDGGVAQDEQDTPEHDAWAASHQPTPDDMAKLYRRMTDLKASMVNVGRTGSMPNSEPSPQDLAEMYDERMRENEQRRRRAMNEEGAGPDMTDITQQIAAQGKGNTDMSFSGGGVADDEDEPAPRRPLTEKELGEYEPYMRDMIRSIPRTEPYGPQTHPRMVPIVPVDRAGSMRYDPSLGSGDLELMASRGAVVPRMGKSYAMGGDVSQVPPMQQLQGMGTDTVPAALTPGELILNKQQQAAVMPRPGMKSKLKPTQLAAIEIAMRKKAHQQGPTI
jgi:hypothetical protein